MIKHMSVALSRQKQILKSIINNSPLQNGGRGEEERGGEEEGAVSEQQTTNGTFQKGNLDHFASRHTQKRPIKS